MKFKKINHLILLGGSRLLIDLVIYLKRNSSYIIDIYTSERQLSDVIYNDGKSLKLALEENNLNYFVSDNPNEDDTFFSSISEHSLGLGLGEVWRFTEKVINKFDGRLLDIMGIALPQYRGGAHYTWQILRQNRQGAINLQIINEDMIQGVFDSGKIIKSKRYLFPISCRIPDDYFRYAVEQEIKFLVEFLSEIQNDLHFDSYNLQEEFSLFFPRLNTKKQAYIDWSWSTLHIEQMICAFDSPYPGASSGLNGKLVRIKKARAEYSDGPFHPFQSGLIYRIENNICFVGTIDGTLIIEEIYSDDGLPFADYKTGDRFFTPSIWLDQSMLNL